MAPSIESPIQIMSPVPFLAANQGGNLGNHMHEHGKAFRSEEWEKKGKGGGRYTSGMP